MASAHESAPPRRGDDLLLCQAFLYLIDQPCRAPSAVLSEFASKLGYEVRAVRRFAIWQERPVGKARTLFRVSLSLVKPGRQDGAVVKHGIATNVKDAKQVAAMNFLEHLLAEVPESLYLLLNRQDKKRLFSTIQQQPEAWHILVDASRRPESAHAPGSTSAPSPPSVWDALVWQELRKPGQPLHLHGSTLQPVAQERGRGHDSRTRRPPSSSPQAGTQPRQQMLQIERTNLSQV